MKKHNSFRMIVSVAGIAAAIAKVECGRGPSEPPHLLKLSELTSSEIKFGRAPKRDRSVKYQPDVVVMENGTETMRSLTPEGLGCVIDADARHADEMVVGKIAFVTSRCVGRVLSTKRQGDALTLILGPVELTDIFRQLDITFNQPIDFSQAIESTLPQLPEMKFPLEGPDAAPPSFGVLTRTSDRYNAALSPNENAPTIKPTAYNFFQTPGSPGILPTPPKVGFEATKFIKNSDGIGVELTHEGHGVRLVAQVQLRMNKPGVEYHLSINNGNIDAKVLLHNAAGLKLAFDSAVSDQFSGNVNWYWVPKLPLTFPISGPVPFSIDIRQEVWIQTEYSARQSSFSAGGDYDINADFGFTYKDKNFTLQGPKGITTRKNLATNMTGVSMGPRGLMISHVVMVTVGLGMAGFTTGPSVQIGTSIGTALGSNIGIIQCSGAALAMNLKAGVGWTIPHPVVSFVNIFLKLVNVPPVPDHGGFFSPWNKLFQLNSHVGAGQVCGTPGGG
jgi:hypothetical protein